MCSTWYYTEIAYWNLAYTRTNKALISSSLTLAENPRRERRARTSGLVTSLEVLRAEAEPLNQEAIIQADRAIEDAQDALRHAMGKPISQKRLVRRFLS